MLFCVSLLPGFSFRRKGRRMAVINLKEEIKNLIFPVSGPVCVSEDPERFKAVNTVLYQYEQMVSSCVCVLMCVCICVCVCVGGRGYICIYVANLDL